MMSEIVCMSVRTEAGSVRLHSIYTQTREFGDGCSQPHQL